MGFSLHSLGSQSQRGFFHQYQEIYTSNLFVFTEVFRLRWIHLKLEANISNIGANTSMWWLYCICTCLKKERKILSLYSIFKWQSGHLNEISFLFGENYENHQYKIDIVKNYKKHQYQFDIGEVMASTNIILILVILLFGANTISLHRLIEERTSFPSRKAVHHKPTLYNSLLIFPPCCICFTLQIH